MIVHAVESIEQTCIRFLGLAIKQPHLSHSSHTFLSQALILVMLLMIIRFADTSCRNGEFISFLAR